MFKLPLSIQRIELVEAKTAGVKLSMARADLIHPLASGNKFYKLKPHIEYGKANDIKLLVSFGGAYSNHIHALAMIANEYGFQCYLYCWLQPCCIRSL